MTVKSLDWPRAWPALNATATLREHVADFVVHEELGFEPSGEGEHSFLHIEKTGLNTLDVQAALARFADVPERDVGLSGMKDKRAITRQWFSVWLPGRAEPDWRLLEQSLPLRFLDIRRHDRKLKRGSHRRNRFELTLSQLEGDMDALQQRLRGVATLGFPNYFGEQRFGYEGKNLRRAMRWMEGRRSKKKMPRHKRGLYLSTLRSVLFNDMLAQRVADVSWHKLLPGDVCQLAGSNSVFAVNQSDPELEQRLRQGDIHPALPLWGLGNHLTGGDVLAQQEALAYDQGIGSFLEQKGLELSYRAMRSRADDFSWEFCDDARLRLTFSLGRGGFATALLREVLPYRVEQETATGDSSE